MNSMPLDQEIPLYLVLLCQSVLFLSLKESLFASVYENQNHRGWEYCEVVP